MSIKLTNERVVILMQKTYIFQENVKEEMKFTGMQI